MSRFRGGSGPDQHGGSDKSRRDRRRCRSVFLREFEDSCQDLVELGATKLERLARGKASAESFFEQWASRTAATDGELLSGRWKYKIVQGTAARRIGLRQIYLHGGRGLLRSALVVEEGGPDCTLTFVLAYEKRDQEHAIDRACAIWAKRRKSDGA
jgi:hypothetical protein